MNDLIPRRAYILETGCGSGINSIIMNDSGYKNTAIDIDKKVLEFAK